MNPINELQLMFAVEGINEFSIRETQGQGGGAPGLGAWNGIWGKTPCSLQCLQAGRAACVPPSKNSPLPQHI